MTDVFPWSINGVDLGDRVLEVGPGPGLATAWLRSRCKILACLEIDFGLAKRLARRINGLDVSVHCGDATAMPYRDQVFSGVVALTMLHHVPSSGLQDKLFREVHRVLAPGGVFAGSDGLASWLMRVFHVRDTMVIVPPATLQSRLETAGFCDVRVEVGTGRFRYSARRHPRPQP